MFGFDCPIWGSPAIETTPSGYDGHHVSSPRAGGDYIITGSATAMVNHLETKEKVTLTNWIVEQNLHHLTPTITSHIIRDCKTWPTIDVFERANRLLRGIERHTSSIGELWKFDIFDDDESFVGTNTAGHAALALSASLTLNEVQYLIKYLKEAELVEDSAVMSSAALSITPKGYAHIAELDTHPSTSLEAFVAMWFDSSMQAAYEDGIQMGIIDAGFRSIRIDQVEHSNKIDDEIVASIRRARFLVADFTSKRDEPRGGVYYEAGFAHGLGIPVIWTCRADMIDNIHFDTRQYNHITWQTPEELRARLKNRIEAVIGEGPLKQDH